MAKYQLTKKEAVKIFEALGFKTAEKWNLKKLAAKVATLPELVEGVKAKSPKVRYYLKRIRHAGEVSLKDERTKAQKAGDKATDDAIKKAKGKADKKKVSKKKAAKKKVAKKKKAKAKKGKVDKFGSREGSNRAKINAALGKTPRTMRQLMDKAKVAYSLNDHLESLLKRKLVKKSDKGYYLA